MTTNDLTNIRRTLRLARLDPDATIAPIADDCGTTARLYRVSAGDRQHVAKIVDDPTRRPQASREREVLSRLGRRLAPLAPSLIAHAATEDAVILVLERLEGRALSGRVALDDAVAELVLDHLGRVWSITEAEVAAAGVDLPSWGRGSGRSGDHRRRVDRFKRRATTFVDDHPDVAAAHHPLLERTARILDTVATRRVEQPRLAEPRLVHGDLHADNLVLGNDGPRILDWQTASLGDPLEDLVRFEIESRLPRRLEDVQASARRLGQTPPTGEHVADAAILCYAGLISGLAGRTRERRSRHENLVCQHLLAPDRFPPIVAAALDLAEATPRTAPTRRGPH